MPLPQNYVPFGRIGTLVAEKVAVTGLESRQMSRSGHIYDEVAGWLELGNLPEAEFAFQQLTRREVSTRRGLRLWLQLSLALERWEEVEAAAGALRQAGETGPTLLFVEAEALQAQGKPLHALVLLTTHATRFTGPTWPRFQQTFRACLAALPSSSAEMALPAKWLPALQAWGLLPVNPETKQAMVG